MKDLECTEEVSEQESSACFAHQTDELPAEPGPVQTWRLSSLKKRLQRRPAHPAGKHQRTGGSNKILSLFEIRIEGTGDILCMKDSPAGNVPFAQRGKAVPDELRANLVEHPFRELWVLVPYQAQSGHP